MVVYLSYGAHWDDVLCSWAELTPDREYLRDLAETVTSRRDDWKAAAGMCWIAPEGLRALLTGLPPAHPIAKIARRELARKSASDRARKACYAKAESLVARHSPSAVFRRMTMENWHALFLALRRKMGESDTAFLLARASESAPWKAAVALGCLAYVPDAATASDLFRLFDARVAKTPRRYRIYLYRALEALPPSAILPRARDWYTVRNPYRRALAESILARHAQPSDLRLLRSGTRRALGANDMYAVTSAMEAFHRLADAAALPEAEAAYRCATYSLARYEAAKTIFAIAPQVFRDRYARDCLHDCEAQTRALAKYALIRRRPRSVSR